jgi:hypothetical protein
VLLGARNLDLKQQRRLFGNETAAEFCERLVTYALTCNDVGDVALITWAAAELCSRKLPEAIARLRELYGYGRSPSTVAAAWSLAAFVAASEQIEVRRDADLARDQLLSARNSGSGLFHHTLPSQRRWHRAHVCCFADQVYPIQALARYHHVFGDESALAVADQCALQICRLQGPAGQWWWHYDARTGDVIEGYPVYSVHQDGMAPMALLDLVEAGGTDYSESIRRGVRWMEHAPEVGRSLIEDDLSLIWRKVGRCEPRKLTRTLRAGLSRISPTLRARWLDLILRPTTVDFESRPYHLGWVLYAWTGGLR